MNSSDAPSSPVTDRTVSTSARAGACFIMLAFALAAFGIARDWMLEGVPNVPVIDALAFMGTSFVMVVFAWVAITGRVPPFFPLGMSRWPFRAPPR